MIELHNTFLATVTYHRTPETAARYAKRKIKRYYWPYLRLRQDGKVLGTYMPLTRADDDENEIVERFANTLHFRQLRVEP